MTKRVVSLGIALLCLTAGCTQRHPSRTEQTDEPAEDVYLLQEKDFDQASRLLEDGNTLEAEALYQRMLQRDSLDVNAIGGLAWVEYNRKNYDAAIELLNQAQTIAPGFTYTYDLQYFVYGANGDTDKQIDVMLSLVEWKWDINGRKDCSEILDKMAEDPDYAAACLKERIQNNPDQKEWSLLLGLLYEHLGMRGEEEDRYVASLPRTLQHETIETQPGKGVLSAGALRTVHYRYDRPVNGFTVTIDWDPDTQDAEMTFSKEGRSISVSSFAFNPYAFEMPADESAFTLRYRPRPKGVVLYRKEPFSVADVDFDGEDELVCVALGAGSHGRDAFRVYELDGRKRDDAPFGWDLDEETVIDEQEKSITLDGYGGVDGGEDIIKYRRQADGTFLVTDSTHVVLQMQGNLIRPVERYHYKRQGGKMVLVKKEVVR